MEFFKSFIRRLVWILGGVIAILGGYNTLRQSLFPSWPIFIQQADQIPFGVWLVIMLIGLTIFGLGIWRDAKNDKPKDLSQKKIRSNKTDSRKKKPIAKPKKPSLKTENAIQLACRPPERSSIGTWAKVTGHRGTNFNALGCVLVLMDAVKEGADESILRVKEMKVTLSGECQRHGISGLPDRPGNSPFDINGEGDGVLDVAQTRVDANGKKFAKFDLWFNDDQIIPVGKYEITLRIQGSLQKAIPDAFQCDKKFLLTYNGEDDLSISDLGV